MSPQSVARSRAAHERTLERIEELYAQLPALSCRGLCEDSCAEHIDASAAERRRLLDAGVDLDAPTPDGACPALTHTFGAGRCSVYTIRPMICRLWGVADSMPCPHGCVPAGGLLDDATAMRWMLTSLEAGGHDKHGPQIRALLELALHDTDAASMLARFLRGDRSITIALFERLRALQK